MSRSYKAPLRRLLVYLLWTSGFRPWVRLAGVALLQGLAPGALAARRRRRIAASIPQWVAPDRSLRDGIVARATAAMNDSEPGPEGFYVSSARRLLDHPLTALGAEELFESGRRTGVPEMEPFRDPDLVDFLYRTPPELLNWGGRSKGPVRQALVRRFPGLGYDRQRKALAEGYLEGIILQEARQAWERLGGAQALADLGLLDAVAYHGEMDGILHGRRAGRAHRILDVLVLEAWVRARL